MANGKEFRMIKHHAHVVSATANKPAQVLGPLPEEEVVRRQLMREVISRLDYHDVKRSLRHDRRFLNDAAMAHGHGARRRAAVPAADVILPKIEGILLELKERERIDSIRMRHIDHTLAELAASIAKHAADCGSSNDASNVASNEASNESE